MPRVNFGAGVPGIILQIVAWDDNCETKYLTIESLFYNFHSFKK
jgi:hypothetical protein